MLAKELLSKPDGFLIATNGEIDYVIENIQRVPTHGNRDDICMYWTLNIKDSGTNIKKGDYLQV